MAGKGPPPKPERMRARRNKPAAPLKVIPLVRAQQPPLPADYEWPAATVRWWKVWGSTPLARDFTAVDWDFLLDTALIHAAYWNGDARLAGELRLRLAKFGATPEDRARLRIQLASADEVEARQERTGSTSRRRLNSVTTLALEDG